jgi:hypothetical protein
MSSADDGATTDQPKARRMTIAAVVALGAGACWLASGQAWKVEVSTSVLTGRAERPIPGSELVPVVAAVATVAVVGVVVSLLLRGRGRMVIGGILVVSAVIAAVPTLQAATGVASGRWAPWLAVVGLALIAVGGAWAGLQSLHPPLPRQSTTTVPTHSQPEYSAAGAEADVDPSDHGALWDALSRGDDPTPGPKAGSAASRDE